MFWGLWVAVQISGVTMQKTYLWRQGTFITKGRLLMQLCIYHHAPRPAHFRFCKQQHSRCIRCCKYCHQIRRLEHRWQDTPVGTRPLHHKRPASPQPNSDHFRKLQHAWDIHCCKFFHLSHKLGHISRGKFYCSWSQLPHIFQCVLQQAHFPACVKQHSRNIRCCRCFHLNHRQGHRS